MSRLVLYAFFIIYVFYYTFFIIIHFFLAQFLFVICKYLNDYCYDSYYYYGHRDSCYRKW